MRILVTGANGVSGRSLTRRLSGRSECQLILTDLVVSAGMIRCDLSDYGSLRAVLAEEKPDRIVNLAGTFSNDFETDYRSNVAATKNLLDAVLETRLAARILLIGSAAEYGAIRPEENPVREDRELRPLSIYGLTKALQSQLMRFYVDRHSMDIVMARPFNLKGRGFSRELFVGSLYAQVEELRGGRIKKITLGHLGDQRDYIDADKAAALYELILLHGKTGEVYNVGSGQAVSMGDLMKAVLLEEGVSLVSVEIDETRGPSKVPIIIADMAKTRSLEARHRR